MKRFQARGVGIVTQSHAPLGKITIPALPDLKTPKEALQWIIAQQKKDFDETILETFSYNILLRNMKLLYKKYPQPKIMRALVTAHNCALHPYSTKHIEDNM